MRSLRSKCTGGKGGLSASLAQRQPKPGHIIGMCIFHAINYRSNCTRLDIFAPVPVPVPVCNVAFSIIIYLAGMLEDIRKSMA